MSQLNVKAFAFACGIVWGVGAFLLGIFAISGWGVKWVELISSLYIGYKATFLGSVIGAVWGFFDAAIGGAFLAWLYNILSDCMWEDDR